jgi:hypothetical protein
MTKSVDPISVGSERRHSWYRHIIERRSEDLEQLEASTGAICEVLRTAPHGGGFGTHSSGYFAGRSRQVGDISRPSRTAFQFVSSLAKRIR